MPTISYENYIQARAAGHAAKVNDLDPQHHTPESIARHAEHVEALRERISELQVLGNHYAAVMEDSATPAALCNVLMDELTDLAGKANLNITSPEVLRLLYPMLRLRAAEKGGY
jgi:hypothetical protein